MNCAYHFRVVDIFHVPVCGCLELSLKSFIPLGERFPEELRSHLAWSAFSAEPRLGLLLITHSFNRKCLHFQLSLGGWRADKLGMETQNRFLPHPPIALWSEDPACLSSPWRGGRMFQWLCPAFQSTFLYLWFWLRSIGWLTHIGR